MSALPVFMLPYVGRDIVMSRSPVQEVLQIAYTFMISEVESEFEQAKGLNP
jgi:hypothetical protein